MPARCLALGDVLVYSTLSGRSRLSDLFIENTCGSNHLSHRGSKRPPVFIRVLFVLHLNKFEDLDISVWRTSRKIRDHEVGEHLFTPQWINGFYPNVKGELRPQISLCDYFHTNCFASVGAFPRIHFSHLFYVLLDTNNDSDTSSHSYNNPHLLVN